MEKMMQKFTHQNKTQQNYLLKFHIYTFITIQTWRNELAKGEGTLY